MRLTCPNCAAQYEVDAAVIPETGRDVQCSSCGHIWFEKPPVADALPPVTGPHPDAFGDEDDEAAALAVALAAPPQAAPGPARQPTAPGPDVPPAPSARTAPEAEDWPVHTPPEADADDPDEAGPAPVQAAVHPSGPRRRTLDDAVLEVLREEAERESRARRAESTPLESQGDLGLAPPAPVPSRPVRPVLPRSQVRPEQAPDAGTPPEDTGLRDRTGRHRLPDIEEINSSLGGLDGDLPGSQESPPVAQRARGFRTGFGLVVGLSLAALLIYAYAPRLAITAPGLAPTLDRYVGSVDTLRLSLDGLARTATDAIRGLSPGDG